MMAMERGDSSRSTAVTVAFSAVGLKILFIGLLSLKIHPNASVQWPLGKASDHDALGLSCDSCFNPAVNISAFCSDFAGEMSIPSSAEVAADAVIK